MLEWIFQRLLTGNGKKLIQKESSPLIPPPKSSTLVFSPSLYYRPSITQNWPPPFHKQVIQELNIPLSKGNCKGGSRLFCSFFPLNCVFRIEEVLALYIGLPVSGWSLWMLD